MCAPRATRSCETSTSLATAWVPTPGGPSTPGWRPPGCLRWARSCRRPRRWPAWPRRVGGARSRPHPRSPGIACAVQGPCRWPSPHSQAALPGDERARVGRQLASARELDGLVHAGGDRGLARGAAHDPGRAEPWYSPLAILTALTRRTVFRLARRQIEGL